MIQNVYAVVDKCSGRAIRIAFSDNDSTLCRDNVTVDLRTKDNPIGLPFQDLQYFHIAEYDTEKLTFKNVPSREVNILQSYNFKTEKPVEKKDTSEPLPKTE